MLKQLEAVANLEGVTVNTEAEHHSGEKAKHVFCKAAPAMEAGLEASAEMIANPIVKLLFSLVIISVKALQKRICVEASAEATTEG
jgi:hypothetical protein